MLKLRLGHALLATTALVAFPAMAQDTGADVPSPPVPGALTAGPDEGDNDGEGVDAEADYDISAPGADEDFGDTIVVIGRNIPEPVRNTAQVVNVLTTEEIARAGDGDVASALGRVTGLW